MENRDFLIEGGLSAIEKKIESLIKPEENYKFKTNCRYDDVNIKTLQIPALIAVLVDVDTTGVLCYNMKNNTTVYLPYSTNFLIFKDGKPEEVKDED